jgi:hypothetical protein
MMNVRDLNVKEIENYTSFVDLSLKLLLIYQSIYLEIKILIIILRKPPLKINNSKT